MYSGHTSESDTSMPAPKSITYTSLPASTSMTDTSMSPTAEIIEGTRIVLSQDSINSIARKVAEELEKKKMMNMKST